ncbi:nickel/cobalt efflux transporter [Pseudoroseicyclus sp. H15]
MFDFLGLMEQGGAAAWAFLPAAVLLGALHGLEPGHSKTMMAAFIVAVRGTIPQAVLLGLSATLSHTLIVWVVALGGMLIWQDVDPEASEPYFQAASGLIIIGLALWMMARTGAGRRHGHDHGHAHPHGDDHSHDHAGSHGHDHAHAHPHPHPAHSHAAEFHPVAEGLQIEAEDMDDAHQRAHAEDIRRRFDGGSVTTGQIVLFGLTGGLIPCPAAITVLLICLQVDRLALGAAVVLAFSIGLALTLVIVGVVAAAGVGAMRRRSAWLDEVAARAPYLSGGLIALVGIYVLWHGLSGLAG